MRKKFLGLIFALAIILTASNPVAAKESALEKTDLTGYTVVIHTNDTHGRAVPDESSGYMGFTSVSALKKLYEERGAEVILMDAGDTLHGLPIATLDKGESIVNIMNLAGYDAMVPGNHDFNYGYDHLKTLEKLMEYDLISANTVDSDTGNNLFDESTIIEKNGIKYGVFGLTTPETAYKTNPKNVEGITFENPIVVAEEEVAKLKQEGAEIIIALTHIGLDTSSEFTTKKIAEQVAGIDLIVDGHSHTMLTEGLKVGDTLIVSTGEYIKNIGVVLIDKQGNMTPSLITPEQFKGTDVVVDEYTAQVVSEQDKILSEKVGETAVDLVGERDFVRTGETNLGDFVTDAFRDATGADIAITNGGGIRASIQTGAITRKDLVTVFPFGNYVVTKEITGQALKDALEVGVASYPESLGGFPQVSGVTFQIDTTKPAGSRAVNIKVNGRKLNLKAIYTMATNDFMAAGGDNYTMFGEFPTLNEYNAMEEIIMNYIKKTGVIKIQNQGRITAIDNPQIVEEAEDKISDETDSIKNDSKTETNKYTLYVVKKGDNLSKIAFKFLGKASSWNTIYQWNKDTIKNPDLIYIGDKIKIYQ
ncbi:MAG: 5-Nucleotidase domain protein [Anaerocolumna sp.]|nr:5-Nucleotidase domain protein [Anaerocolumna sp.]